MREWHGFTSFEPRNMAETIDRQMREMSAAIKRISKGQVPSGSGASMQTVLAPAATVVTADGNEVSANGRLTRIDVTNPASPTNATIYDSVPVGVYRVTFAAHILTVATTCALTVRAIFNTGDEAIIMDAVPVTTGTYVSASVTFPTNIIAPIEYELTYTNTVDMEASLILEAL